MSCLGFGIRGPMNDNIVQFPHQGGGEPVLLELPDYIVVPASVCPLITSPLVRAPLVRIAKNAVSAIEDGYMQELDKHDRKRASIAVIALLRLLEGYAEEDETA